MSFSEALRGAAVAQAGTTALVLFWLRPSGSLRAWYRELGVAAVAFDVLSLALGAYVGARLGARLPTQLAAGVLVGVAHDVAFGAVLARLPRGANGAVDRFKDYAAQKGGRVLVDDALMIAAAVALARALRGARHADALAALAAYVNLLLVQSF